MPRRARVVITEYPYHLTQRGNNRQTVFVDDQDYEKYLMWFGEYADLNGLRVWAYCLMPNHVHFVAVPEESHSLGVVFRNTNTRYTQYFNAKYERAGHLWQSRFYSCPLDDAHTYTAVRYVETNPVRAGIVATPDDYPWSSAQANMAGDRGALLSGDCWLLDQLDDWRAYLAVVEEETKVDELRRLTRTGRPAGSPFFLGKLEKLAGCVLGPKKAGRPRKQ